jgi:hypothetical protein
MLYCVKITYGFVSDESAIYRSACKPNEDLWASGNLHFTLKVENNPPQIMFWAADHRLQITADHFSEQYSLNHCCRNVMPGSSSEFDNTRADKERKHELGMVSVR